MSIVSYAQNFEDVLLWRALHDVKGGRYIDVGAHDPVIDSVSLAFYNAGWRGVSVEPTPDYAARLRAARPDDIVIEAAVSDATGPIRFFELSGLSSGIREVAEHHGRSGHPSREITVNTVRLEHLLNLTDDDVHWLKIDVEGMERQVLRSWGDCPKRPWILVIEATFPNTQKPTHQLWIEEVISRGYEKVFFDGLSCYFVHHEHKDRGPLLAAPANVFDAFSITAMHFSAKPLREELDRSGKRLDEERRKAEETTATLSQAQQKLDAAVQDRIRTLERLVTAEEQHRHAFAAAVDHHLDAERRVGEAYAGANASLVELARLEERNAQLQDKLDRANQVVGWVRERAGRLEAELKRTTEARDLAGNRLAEAHRDLFEVRSTLFRVEIERDEAQTAVEDLRTDFEERRAAADRSSEDLSAQINEFRAALEKADALVALAVAERSGFWHRLGRVLGVSGDDQAWRALSSWSMRTTNRSRQAVHDLKNESKTAMKNPSSTEVRNPYLRADSLEELLSWHGVNFVRCAYVTVLGRQPDPDGEHHYADQLRRGRSKADVLWQLRRSPEAANHDPGIAGFDRALRRARARSWPRRVFRSALGYTAPRSSDLEITATAGSTPVIAQGAGEADGSAHVIAAEIEALKLLVDGFGHALRGVANAQARHEKQISALSSKASPDRPEPSGRSNGKK